MVKDNKSGQISVITKWFSRIDRRALYILGVALLVCTITAGTTLAIRVIQHEAAAPPPEGRDGTSKSQNSGPQVSGPIANNDRSSAEGIQAPPTSSVGSLYSAGDKQSAAPANTSCTNKALIAEPAYMSAVKSADNTTDSAANRVISIAGGYTAGAVVVVNDIYRNGNIMLNNAWQNYTNQISGCQADMSPPVLYTALPVPQPSSVTNNSYTYDQALGLARQQCGVILSQYNAGSSSAMQACINAELVQYGY